MARYKILSEDQIPFFDKYLLRDKNSSSYPGPERLKQIKLEMEKYKNGKAK